MIVSAVFVYPEGRAGVVTRDEVLEHKAFVMDHWRFAPETELAALECYEIDGNAYNALARVALKEKSTRRIIEAMMSALGNVPVGEHMQKAQQRATELGLSGFTLRVTELDYPDGFPYLAIGVVAG